MDNKREKLEVRWAQLRRERTTWEIRWRDIGEQMLPYGILWDWRGHSERNRGDAKEDKIINSKPVRGLNTLTAGMMAGLTSPARPWFNLTTTDKLLSRSPAVRLYLDQVRQVMLDVLQASNFYDVLANAIYPGLGSIGSPAMFMEEDEKKGVHFGPMAIGGFWLDHNAKGEIDTCFRKLWWTVRQIVQEFGLEACSKMVRAAYEAGRLNETWAVIHAVYPNSDRVASYGADGMAWSSCWWEETNPDKAQFLRESGYREFPVLAPRWSIRPGDVYGRGPGWEIRGDCKALQHREKRIAEMVDLVTRPPTVRQGELAPVNLIPGGVTYVPMGQEVGVKPLIELPPQAIAVMREEIQRHEQRIDSGLYADLWLAALRDSEQGGSRPTATEVQARKIEVMLMLGPLLQNLENGLLKPLIDRLYLILDRNNLLPYPPDELAGQAFSVEFISILHQAQESTGASGLRAFVQEILAAAQVNPEIFDKIDVDAIVDQFAEMYGISPEVVRSDSSVKQLRDARAKQQQIAQEGAAAAQAAKGMKDASAVDLQKIGQMGAAMGVSPVADAQARGPLG